MARAKTEKCYREDLVLDCLAGAYFAFAEDLEKLCSTL